MLMSASPELDEDEHPCDGERLLHVLQPDLPGIEQRPGRRPAVPRRLPHRGQASPQGEKSPNRLSQGSTVETIGVVAGRLMKLRAVHCKTGPKRRKMVLQIS